jgi:hypothetical protein
MLSNRNLFTCSYAKYELNCLSGRIRNWRSNKLGENKNSKTKEAIALAWQLVLFYFIHNSFIYYLYNNIKSPSIASHILSLVYGLIFFFLFYNIYTVTQALEKNTKIEGIFYRSVTIMFFLLIIEITRAIYL